MDQFELFFKNNEKIHKRLKEAENVIERLKEEVSISNNVETNLRLQLTRILDRNASLQRDINTMKQLKVQSRKQQETLTKQETTIQDLLKLSQKLQKTVEEKVKSVSTEKELLAKNQKLGQQVEELDNQLNLARIENQVIINQKDDTINQLNERLQIATNAMEKAKLDYEMMRNNVDRVQLLHSKQIMNYQEDIRRYEKERSEILSDNPPEIVDSASPDEIDLLWDKKINVTWADAARRAKALQENDTSSQDQFNMNSIINEEKPKTFKVKKPRKVPQAPLHVHSLKDDPQQTKRKRLFSNNSNHFVF